MKKLVSIIIVIFGILVISEFSVAGIIDNKPTISENPEKMLIKQISMINDTTPPEIEVTWETYKNNGVRYVDFICESYDNESGIDRVEMYIDNLIHETIEGSQSNVYTFTFKWSKTIKTSVFKFVAYNGAGLSAFKEVDGSDIVVLSPWAIAINLLLTTRYVSSTRQITTVPTSV